MWKQTQEKTRIADRTNSLKNELTKMKYMT